MASGCLPLVGDCTIGRVRDLHAQVVEAFEAGGTLTLDMAGVTQADITIVQLLVSACRSAAEAGREIAISPISGALRGALGRAGVAFDDASGRILVGG